MDSSKNQKLGIIIRILQPENLALLMKTWESTMAGDLESFFLGVEKGQPATETFQDNIYQDVAIRYLNFPDSTLTIDYVISDDYLIITTSKESIYAVIDQLLK